MDRNIAIILTILVGITAVLVMVFLLRNQGSGFEGFLTNISDTGAIIQKPSGG